jgi:EAL domain-containing protein (putative c-di-GMP-specific phosphodiesterase class I)/GGDEF domain-containing protein
MSNHEQARLAALKQLNLLDTSPSESFDRITRMAGQLFNLPVAAVSLTDKDRQWFKSRLGVEHFEIPRFKACCGEVADTSKALVVNDLQASPYYKDSHLAQSGIRFYAGAPLITREGYSLGAMCVLGPDPREVTPDELTSLQDLASMVMAQIELQHAMGRVDPVSGLPNYYQFLEDIADMALDSPNTGLFAVSTELIDLSESSSLQRVMGPSYLDQLTRVAGEYLRDAMDVGIRVYHTGPCQFAYLLDGTEEDVLASVLSLRSELKSLMPGDAAPYLLRPVTGVAAIVLGETKPTDVLRMAHSAAHDARLSELGAGIYSKALDTSYLRRFTLLDRFRDALSNKEGLYLVYQPRIDFANSHCVAVEALMRWHDPELGAISPAEFIPLIENTPLVRDLTDWVVRTSIAQAARWHRQGIELSVSVNIAAANLEETDFSERLQSYMVGSGLPVTAIELEITESSLVSQGRAATEQLNQLMLAGYKIAIDDFGTGYSSLAYLNQIPAQVVKIDQSFVQNLDSHKRSLTLVKSMISMAHDLG